MQLLQNFYLKPKNKRKEINNKSKKKHFKWWPRPLQLCHQEHPKDQQCRPLERSLGRHLCMTKRKKKKYIYIYI